MGMSSLATLPVPPGFVADHAGVLRPVTRRPAATDAYTATSASSSVATAAALPVRSQPSLSFGPALIVTPKASVSWGHPRVSAIAEYIVSADGSDDLRVDQIDLSTNQRRMIRRGQTATFEAYRPPGHDDFPANASPVDITFNTPGAGGVSQPIGYVILDSAGFGLSRATFRPSENRIWCDAGGNWLYCGVSVEVFVE